LEKVFLISQPDVIALPSEAVTGKTNMETVITEVEVF
jgi:hypothetical protein